MASLFFFLKKKVQRKERKRTFKDVLAGRGPFFFKFNSIQFTSIRYVAQRRAVGSQLVFLFLFLFWMKKHHDFLDDMDFHMAFSHLTGF